ncbi:MAG: hypothetical protein JXR76_20300 [Deltaproteobacteria bacterium]|nr:hypothetical protein [Deltaproteobacteria bacterium]
MKKILGGVGTAVAVVAIIAFKFLAPSAEVAVKNATGSGWDEARDYFATEISKLMKPDFEGLVLDETNQENITNCIVDKSIKFLNETDCSYLYNTATTSETEHLANQETCLAKVRFTEHQEGFRLECLKTYLPRSWKLMEKVFMGIYEEAYIRQGIPEAEAKQIGECISGKLVALFDGRQYKLIDDQSRDVENLFFPADKYIPDFEKDEEIVVILTECAPKDDAAE